MRKVDHPSFDRVIDEQFPNIQRVSGLGVQKSKNQDVLVLQMVVKPDPENEQHSHPYGFSREGVVLLAKALNSFLDDS